jgi:AcrR family transcriptional regulator
LSSTVPDTVPPGHAATPERILDAAARCIRRWGIRRVSMNDVAREAGLSRGSVYRYFPERDALVQAVLERNAAQNVAAALPAVRRRRSLAAKVAEAAVFIRAHVDDELSLGLRGRPEEPELATLRLARVESTMTHWIDFWVPFLAEARENGEVRADLELREAAEWIMRILLSLTTVPSVVVDLDDPEQVRRFVAAHLVRGFAA